MNYIPTNWRGIVNFFDGLPKGIREYFKYVPDLLEKFPHQVALAYIFSQIELAHRNTLYCSIVKKYRAESRTVWSVIQRTELKQDQFEALLQAIIEIPLDKTIFGEFKSAKKIRNKIMHGHLSKDQELRKAIVNALSYANTFNDFVYRHARFKPFGSLRGFSGSGKRLTKKVTCLFMKGLGFLINCQ